MAGPVVIDPNRAARRAPNFGTATRDDVPAFLGIMRILHQEPNSSMFARLLEGSPRTEDEVPLAHLFEEISTLALHGLIVEDLLFDAFAVDHYYERLEDRINRVRTDTGNSKFAENFEIAAELARQYRDQRPSKVR
jgi:hypothetical protein